MRLTLQTYVFDVTNFIEKGNLDVLCGNDKELHNRIRIKLHSTL